MNLNIRFTWIASFDNYEPITGYNIIIGTTKQEYFIENIEFCDGSKFNADS